MDDSAVSIGFSVTNYTTGSHGQSQVTFGIDQLGSAVNNSSGHGRRGFQRSIHAPAQDDGCRLVLGLGPTPAPEVNSCDCGQQPAGADKSRPPVTLFGQSFSFADPGALSLGIHRGRDNAGATKHLGVSVPAGTVISFSTADEGSTSARRSSGGYMPLLLLAPLPNYSTAEEEQGLLDDTDNSNNGGTDPRGFRFSPEPSASMTEASFGGASSDVVTVASNPGQQTQRRHPKKCRFKGCSKGARGASGLCIAHGGGQRCQKPGCYKGAESRTAYCKAHGGGRRCLQLGCTKSAEGKTDHCIAHGGGRRCGYLDCPKAARGKSGRCIKHGGGKRCSVEGCIRSAEGRVGLCISHGGGRRCQFPDCRKGAQGSTLYCKSHGGGKRCVFEGCGKGAEGSTPLCKAHGGGKRCMYEGGGVCPKSVHGGTDFCVAHGGGKRCAVPECSKSARGRTDCCVKHGGGKRCRVDGCGKSAQGSTEYCKAHGGGKRCNFGGVCEKFARGRSGLCAAHGTLVASRQRRSGGGGMIGPGLFRGIVRSASAANMYSEYSSSGVSTVSDCDGSPEAATGRHELIPPQVLVPHSMKSLTAAAVQPPARSREGGVVAVPEGRVHGGGLLSLLGGSFRNVDVDKL
ncbi:putative WRKY transcription factor 19 [Zea mays]|uniref:Putative WRKY transcription factor 19 n=1 Tax=Zea mays TaxID=4577 RepID=A0A3L6F6C6_MAIZE|nr:putative WRKY transcription factor 19 [Zea mays]